MFNVYWIFVNDDAHTRAMSPARTKNETKIDLAVNFTDKFTVVTF